jgi:hypothetical protein
MKLFTHSVVLILQPHKKSRVNQANHITTAMMMIKVTTTW